VADDTGPRAADGDRGVTVPLAVVAGLFLASIALRPQLLAIGPLLPFIRDDLGLPATVAGLLTTIPVLCMGLFAPVGPRLAARLGPRVAFAVCLGLITGFGLLRSVAPGVPALVATTFGIGVGIGMAGAIPSMVVARHVPRRPALGTGAYAAGIVAGSSIAAGIAVPLATDEAWRTSLALISLVSVVAIPIWLLLVPHDPGATRGVGTQTARLPWREPLGWLLVLVFGLQSLVFYGIVSWVPNAYVERGWTPAEAGALIAVFNAIGLITTIGVPLIADRLGRRRSQLLVSGAICFVALVGLAAAPTAAYVWISLLGLALGAFFPLALTLPIDVARDRRSVGSIAALMLLGGYVLSSAGPVVLGAARDATGSFDASLWVLAGIGAVMVAVCAALTPARMAAGIATAPLASEAVA
jgi:MFS transporter, CP family, cyanate transporter